MRNPGAGKHRDGSFGQCEVDNRNLHPEPATINAGAPPLNRRCSMNTRSTSAGPRLAFEPCGLTIPSNPTAALAFATRADRRADACLASGRPDQAERLAHAAYEARSRAIGGRA